MGKKSQPSAPEMPDINEMIEASTRANRVNTVTPYGSQTFNENPDGTWSSQVAFSPQMQALFDQQMNYAAQAPSSFKSQGMGSNLRNRIDQKLGRGAESEFKSADISPVDLAAAMESAQAPTEPTAPPDRPSNPIAGGGGTWPNRPSMPNRYPYPRDAR